MPEMRECLETYLATGGAGGACGYAPKGYEGMREGVFGTSAGDVLAAAWRGEGKNRNRIEVVGKFYALLGVLPTVARVEPILDSGLQAKVEEELRQHRGAYINICSFIMEEGDLDGDYFFFDPSHPCFKQEPGKFNEPLWYLIPASLNSLADVPIWSVYKYRRVPEFTEREISGWRHTEILHEAETV